MRRVPGSGELDGFDEVGAVVADGADSHAHGQGGARRGSGMAITSALTSSGSVRAGLSQASRRSGGTMRGERSWTWPRVSEVRVVMMETATPLFPSCRSSMSVL